MSQASKDKGRRAGASAPATSTKRLEFPKAMLQRLKAAFTYDGKSSPIKTEPRGK